MKFKHIKREKVFKNDHISVYEEDLLLPDGNEVKWTFLGKFMAVGIVAFTPENKLLLVKQYRPATKNELIEIPAGLVDRGEDTKKAAIRELEEETGYRANKIKKIFEYYSSPGISDSKMVIYLAEDLVKTEQRLDECEFLEVIEVDLEEIDKILNKSLDGKTTLALNYIKCQLKKEL